MKKFRFLLPLLNIWSGILLSTTLICACTITAPTTSVSARVQQVAAQLPGDISLILTPILQHNPKYAQDVVLIGKTLPAVLQNGPISVGSVTAALAGLPQLTVQERQDLQYITIGLPAAIQLAQAISGQSAALYTDPNVAAVVNAFAAGLVSAGSAVTGP